MASMVAGGGGFELLQRIMVAGGDVRLGLMLLLSLEYQSGTGIDDMGKLVIKLLRSSSMELISSSGSSIALNPMEIKLKSHGFCLL